MAPKLTTDAMKRLFFTYPSQYTSKNFVMKFFEEMGLTFTGSRSDFVFRKELKEELMKYCDQNGVERPSMVAVGMHFGAAKVATIRLGCRFGKDYGYVGIKFRKRVPGRQYVPAAEFVPFIPTYPKSSSPSSSSSSRTPPVVGAVSPHSISPSLPSSPLSSQVLSAIRHLSNPSSPHETYSLPSTLTCCPRPLALHSPQSYQPSPAPTALASALTPARKRKISRHTFSESPSPTSSPSSSTLSPPAPIALTSVLTPARKRKLSWHTFSDSPSPTSSPSSSTLSSPSHNSSSSTSAPPRKKLYVKGEQENDNQKVPETFVEELVTDEHLEILSEAINQFFGLPPPTPETLMQEHVQKHLVDVDFIDLVAFQDEQ